jgi:hypothetical protein
MMYSNIFYDGREAFRSEISEDDNPYEEGSSEFYQWADGWMDAFGEWYGDAQYEGVDFSEDQEA